MRTSLSLYFYFSFFIIKINIIPIFFFLLGMNEAHIFFLLFFVFNLLYRLISQYKILWFWISIETCQTIFHSTYQIQIRKYLFCSMEGYTDKASLFKKKTLFLHIFLSVKLKFTARKTSINIRKIDL